MHCICNRSRRCRVGSLELEQLNHHTYSRKQLVNGIHNCNSVTPRPLPDRHFVLTRAHPGRTSRSVTHPQIALGQARLTPEFFANELPEKKLQLVDMSILSILLRPEPESHSFLARTTSTALPSSSSRSTSTMFFIKGCFGLNVEPLRQDQRRARRSWLDLPRFLLPLLLL